MNGKGVPRRIRPVPIALKHGPKQLPYFDALFISRHCGHHRDRTSHRLLQRPLRLAFSLGVQPFSKPAPLSNPPRSASEIRSCCEHPDEALGHVDPLAVRSRKFHRSPCPTPDAQRWADGIAVTTPECPPSETDRQFAYRGTAQVTAPDGLRRLRDRAGSSARRPGASE